MFLKKSKSSVIISVAAFFIIFFIFCGFAIDFSLVLVSRAQLQNAVETTALNSLDENKEEKIKKRAQTIFNYSKTGNIRYAQITSIETKPDPNRAILITATAPIRPYFLSALGINIIELQARASAMANYTTPQIDTSFDVPNHIQYKLTRPFLARNKEIFVVRGGENKERNFRVFAGLSNKEDDESNLRWIEITCSEENHWYGINDNCSGTENLGAAKYIRLSLDTTSPPNYYWDEFEIAKISVLTSIKLIKSSDF